MKILLVDDDQALITVFETALKNAGHQTITCNSGKQAIEQVKLEKPDVIFLDQILPDISGNEVLKTLKEDTETKAIPVAIVSNFNEGELMQEAINMGASDYIYKYNIAPTDLAAKAEELARTSAAAQAAQQPQTTEEDDVLL